MPRPWARWRGPIGVGFVNVFDRATLYAGATKPYTINEIYLTSEGNRLLAVIIDHTLLPEGPMFKRDARRSKSSDRPCSRRISTGSTAIARWMATRSTVAGQICTS